MASSKVMPSSNSGNSDLTRRPSASSAKPSPVIPNYASNPNPSIPNGDSRQPLSSEIAGTPAAKSGSLMTLDGFLRNVYGEDPDDAAGSVMLEAEIPLIDAAGAITAVGDSAEPSIRRQSSSGGARKTADDVWREIVAGKSERKECKVEAPDEMMTLEDFLAKAGAVEEEDVKVSGSASVPAMGMEWLSSDVIPLDPMVQSSYPPSAMVEGQVIGGVGGRRKRRGGAIMEPMDKVAQQRQKRMIKNRESAARSRERKQAYQEELESLAGKLEEENEQLQREKLERTKERYKQLMEKVVPVVEKKKPPRPLRRVRSMQCVGDENKGIGSPEGIF